MKKNNRKIGMVVSIALMLACVLSGCGSSAPKNDMAVEESVMDSASGMTGGFDGGWDGGEIADDMLVEEGAAESNKTQVQTDRKLIKTVDMTVETKEFDAFLPHIQSRVNQLGGYVESMETYNGSKYTTSSRTRNAYMTIRIPKDHLDTFLTDISEGGNVIRQSENVKDITLTYVDLESHKKVLLTEQERMLELMEKAESIEDIIILESRLSEIRYQIESMEAQLRTYDNKVNYSTVSLSLQEVKELTPVEEEKTGWAKVKDGFVESAKNVWEGIMLVLVWFLINIPHLCLWGIVVVVIIKVRKRILKKRANKRKEESTKVKV